MEEDIHAFTYIVLVSFRFDVHLNAWCKIVNLRHMVDMIVRRVTSHLTQFVEVGVRDTKPKHSVFNLFEMRQVPHIKVDNKRWLIQR